MKNQERSRFIWQKGVLGFGLTVAFLVTLVEAIFQIRSGLNWFTFLLDLVLNLVFFGLIGGYLWGYIMWERFGHR